MGKKVKCNECHLSMKWTLPVRVTDKNVDYARVCLAASKRSIVCGETMKTKNIAHEQYCKKFIHKSEIDDEINERHQKEISELESKIIEYESQALYN